MLKMWRSIYRTYYISVKLGIVVCCYTEQNGYSPSTNHHTVLLLDEADIFLEQRSLADLDRNGLVSGKSKTIVIRSTRAKTIKCSSGLWNTMTVS